MCSTNAWSSGCLIALRVLPTLMEQKYLLGWMMTQHGWKSQIRLSAVGQPDLSILKRNLPPPFCFQASDALSAIHHCWQTAALTHLQQLTHLKLLS